MLTAPNAADTIRPTPTLARRIYDPRLTEYSILGPG